MLAELRVRDLAVIRDAHLDLGPGLNVLTGETGAGKSLLVDALALLLGERAAGELVRPGADRAVVEGVFETAGRKDLAAALEELGLEADDGRLVVKREVQGSGRSRAWVNGSPLTVGALEALGARLVDLHGQHETQSLLRPDAQRTILDAFADASGAAAAVRRAHEAWLRLVDERRELEVRQAEARKRADYLRHVADEIARVAPKPGEFDAVEAEARRLFHAEELGRTGAELAGTLEADEGGAMGQLAHAARLLGALERIDPDGARGWREMLDAAVLNAGELARAVGDYAATVEADPARLAAVEQRRDLLYRLDQKYGPGLERVLATLADARRELELLDTAGTDLAALGARIAEAEEAVAAHCRTLTAKRAAAAKRLGPAVSRHLNGLGMPDGVFRAALEPLEAPSANGAERVEFLVRLNPGMDERPLARSASGGELSRVMLALKAELARHDAIPTMVFDEVDQGVGGHVAGRVAAALVQVAAGHQVLVITHLPQVAAAAAQHLVVAKASGGGIVQADVRRVSGAERVDEVTRMLGGEDAPAVARKHAEALLRKARQGDGS
ncbi:MAG: DNA repair protein RecN [Gemmatimonadales bacterium]|jgi:DNA repair protein RecN (Recombination protein N)